MPKPPLLQTASQVLSSNDLYSLSIDRGQNKTIIVMKMHIPQVNTSEFPQTRNILKLYLPTILESTCYNEEQLPFYKEVSKTEIGHLFEHILLEYLCLVKLENGYDSVCYEGVTDWNWLRDPKGTFHITIKANNEELDILSLALERSMILTNAILSQEETISLDLQTPQITTRH
jgi:hypothetical protein